MCIRLYTRAEYASICRCRCRCRAFQQHILLTNHAHYARKRSAHSVAMSRRGNRPPPTVWAVGKLPENCLLAGKFPYKNATLGLKNIFWGNLWAKSKFSAPVISSVENLQKTVTFCRPTFLTHVATVHISGQISTIHQYPYATQRTEWS